MSSLAFKNVYPFCLRVSHTHTCIQYNHYLLNVQQNNNTSFKFPMFCPKTETHIHTYTKPTHMHVYTYSKKIHVCMCGCAFLKCLPGLTSGVLLFWRFYLNLFSNGKMLNKKILCSCIGIVEV